MDDDDEPNDVFDISSVQTATITSFDEEKLKRAFLDRLSEVVSGEKGGKQVACCMMVEWPDHVDVLVAKNNMFRGDEECIRMLQELALGLQEVNKSEVIDITSVDKGPLRLRDVVLQLYRTRILHYAKTALEMLDAAMPATTDDKLAQLPANERALVETLALFRQLATKTEYLDTPEGRIEVVQAAFNILQHSSELDKIITTKYSEKLTKNLRFLRRPRTCFHTFVRAAQHMSSFQSLEILPVLTASLGGAAASRKKRRSSSAEIWSAAKVFESLGSSLTDATAKQILGNGSRRPWTRNRLIQSYNSQKLPLTETHAEVQILLAAQHHNCTGAHVVTYIGCSKRSCFLCAEFVRASGSYGTRGSHGKLYNQWTVPLVPWMTPAQRQSLAKSLRLVEAAMKKKLLHSPTRDRPVLFAPESTVGGSSVSTLAFRPSEQGHIARLVEERLSDQREDVVLRWYQGNSNGEGPSHDNSAETFDTAEVTETTVDSTSANRLPAQTEDDDWHECEVCRQDTDSHCTACGRGWFCGKTCQDKMSIYHLRNCCARPITTADLLFENLGNDEIPEDPEVREDFGFTRLSHQHEESHLTGLYQGLRMMDICSAEVHEWRQTGVLVDKIVEIYHTIPESSRGGYFPWFERNKHILDPKTPRVSQEDMRMDEICQAIANAALRLGPPYSKGGWCKIQPPSRQYCFLFYAFVLESIHPNPNMLDFDMWYDFGFVLCQHKFEEMRLCGLYIRLFAGNKYLQDYAKSLGSNKPLLGCPKEPTHLCPLEEFWKAFETNTLPELFDSYSVGRQLISNPHLREFFSAPSPRPPVWRLYHFLALDSASTESALRFRGTYPPLEAAIQKFGFHPQMDARANIELRKFYGKLLDKSSPLAVQAARDAGQLLEHALALLDGSDIDESVRKVLENMRCEKEGCAAQER